MITFNDDGQWEQNQDDMIEWFGIVIEDENIVPNWEVLTTVSEEIEKFDLEKLTALMIEKHECELALLEEFENNLEKN